LVEIDRASILYCTYLGLGPVLGIILHFRLVRLNIRKKLRIYRNNNLLDPDPDQFNWIREYASRSFMEI
jgi:hypothetical protein